MTKIEFRLLQPHTELRCTQCGERYFVHSRLDDGLVLVSLDRPVCVTIPFDSTEAIVHLTHLGSNPCN